MYVGVAKMKCRENRHVELETSLRCWIEGVVVDLVICFRPLENKRVKQNLAKFWSKLLGSRKFLHSGLWQGTGGLTAIRADS